MPVPWPYRGNKISMAGTLDGLEDIQPGRNLKVKPFAIAGVRQTRSGDEFPSDVDFDGGLDVKYGITSQLTLDLTYRTDFAQVEVDQQQLNLTRFNLFFRRSASSSWRHQAQGYDSLFGQRVVAAAVVLSSPGSEPWLGYIARLLLRRGWWNRDERGDAERGRVLP